MVQDKSSFYTLYFKGNPEPEIKWYKGDVRIRPRKNDKRVRLGYDTDNDVNILEIDSASIEDGGEYMMKASNDNGSAKVTIVVQVRPKEVSRPETTESSKDKELSSEDLTDTVSVSEVKGRKTEDKLNSVLDEEFRQALTKHQQSRQFIKMRHTDDLPEEPAAMNLQTVKPKHIAQQPLSSENDDARSSSYEVSAEEEVKLPKALEQKSVVLKLKEKTTAEEYRKVEVEKSTSIEEITTKILNKDKLIEQTGSISEEFDEVLKIDDVTQVISEVSAKSFLQPTSEETRLNSYKPLKTSTTTPLEFQPVDAALEGDENTERDDTKNVVLESDMLVKPDEELSNTVRVKKTKNKPVLLIKPEPIAVKEGKSIVLSCRAAGNELCTESLHLNI